MTLNFKDFITVSQFAKSENVTRRTVYRWLEAGHGPKHEQAPDGQYFIYKDSLLTWKRPVKRRKPA